MKREGHDNVDFFVGTEVERTPAFGMKTLFVVGIQPVDSIGSRLLQVQQHIFFGANHSFDPKDALEWQRWESMIFIPQIRVSVPYTKLWNYNTMLKIDDKDFDATNPGVWCHSLHSLMSRETFTSWDDYRGDSKL